MNFVFNDGGRAAAGFKGATGDCVTRAIAIATGLSYRDVYAAINEQATTERRGTRKRGVSNARTGVYKTTQRRYLAALGWTWRPTMAIGQGCKVHLKADELPAGRLVVAVSKHLVAVIDGVIHDTTDPSRNGSRCVYGYYTAPRAAPASAPVVTIEKAFDGNEGIREGRNGRTYTTGGRWRWFVVVDGVSSEGFETRREAVEWAAELAKGGRP